MIARLVASLRALAVLPPAALAGDAGRRLAADCADAVRLELDCPQQELTRDQRAVLHRLGDLLEDAHAPADAVHRAASAAARALDLVPGR